MEIDQQTFRELDVFVVTPGKESIMALLDHTKTSGGRLKLKQRISKPKNDIHSIYEVQEAISFLEKSPALWETRIDEFLITRLEKYLASNIIPVSAKNRFFTYLGSFRYKHLYSEMALGTRIALEFLFELNSLVERSGRGGVPELLARYLSTFSSFLNKAYVKNVLKGNRKPPTGVNVFKLDCVLRTQFNKDFEKLIDRFYEWEALLSLAKAKKALHFVFPTFHKTRSATLKISGLRHPFLKTPVRNNFGLEPPVNFLFLTGPNMAGKSTFLKVCGVSVLLAHMGMGVPALKMELTVFDTLFSSTNSEENIQLGYSYFYSEGKRVKEIALKLNKKVKAFVIFDELFKGTNIKDARDASNLVIKGFLNWETSLFALSTHLTELESEVSPHKNIQCHFFETRVSQGKPRFSYKLKKGISHERLGLLILKNEKIPELLAQTKPS